MFGHHEPAQATVLYAQDVTGNWEDIHHVKIEFVLEVHPPNEQAFRAQATHHFIMFTHYPQVGDVVNVKYHPKSREVELDLKDDTRYGALRLKHLEQAERQAAQVRRDALLAAPPETPPKTKEQWLDEGSRLFGLKQYKEARAAFEQMLRLNPNDASGRNNKRMTFRELKRCEEVLVASEQALQLNPNQGIVHSIQGQLLEALGRSAEAEQAFNKARQLGYKG